MAELSATSAPTSPLQPPDGDGVKAVDRRRMDCGGIPVDLAKRLIEFQAQNDRMEDENRRLLARNQKLEEKIREQRLSLEEKDEQIIRLYEEVMSLKGLEDRWKEKYGSLYEKFQRDREEHESVEAKCKEKVENIGEKCWKLELENRKLEMDFKASRRRADEIGEEFDTLKKTAEDLGILLEESDVVIWEQKKRNEELEREKAKMEKELGDRVDKLEAGVAKRERLMSLGNSGKENNSAEAGIAVDDLGCNVVWWYSCLDCDSGPKPVGISILDPKKENLEADVRLTTCALKPTEYHIVQISDDEDEGGEKQIQASFASPSVAKCAQTKRKSEAATCSAEKQAQTKRCKSDGVKDGKVWKTAVEMQNAFETDPVLCMKSVCALYRKHKSLGVWKDCLDANKAFARGLEIRGVALGKILTRGDPEGRMKKSLTDLEREDPRGIKDCRFIAKYNHKELFEIYKNNLDPFFLS